MVDIVNSELKWCILVHLFLYLLPISRNLLDYPTAKSAPPTSWSFNWIIKNIIKHDMPTRLDWQPVHSGGYLTHNNSYKINSVHYIHVHRSDEVDGRGIKYICFDKYQWQGDEFCENNPFTLSVSKYYVQLENARIQGYRRLLVESRLHKFLLYSFETKIKYVYINLFTFLIHRKWCETTEPQSENT